MTPFVLTGALCAALLVLAVTRALRERGLDRWLLPYFLHSRKRRPPRCGEEVHVLICLADHFEPKGDQATPEQAWARVQRWVDAYPRQLGNFRDSDGRPPRHSFFFPIEEYE